MNTLGADIISSVGLHLPFFDCVALQAVSRSFLKGLRRAVVWKRWGESFEAVAAGARGLSAMRRRHLWALTHCTLAEAARMPPSYVRVTKELYDLRREPLQVANAGPVNARADFLDWRGFIEGPPGTVYEGGVFWLTLKFRADYPFKPPHVRFLTKIYHPNIGRSGAISLDILYDSWSPALTTIGQVGLIVQHCTLWFTADPDDH